MCVVGDAVELPCAAECRLGSMGHRTVLKSKGAKGREVRRKEEYLFYVYHGAWKVIMIIVFHVFDQLLVRTQRDRAREREDGHGLDSQRIGLGGHAGLAV